MIILDYTGTVANGTFGGIYTLEDFKQSITFETERELISHIEHMHTTLWCADDVVLNGKTITEDELFALAGK